MYDVKKYRNFTVNLLTPERIDSFVFNDDRVTVSGRDVEDYAMVYVNLNNCRIKIDSVDYSGGDDENQFKILDEDLGAVLNDAAQIEHVIDLIENYTFGIVM